MRISFAPSSLAVLALALASPPATAADADGPSFSCAHARTAAEVAICRDPVLRRDDLHIARRYRILEKGLPAAQRRALRADQAAFIALRDAVADRSDPGIDQTLADVLGVRAAFLDRIQLDPPVGLVGTWGALEGEFEIRPAARGQLRFYGSLTDPYAARWTCSFDGRGSVRDGTLSLRDGDDPAVFMDVSREGSLLLVTETDGRGQAVPSPGCGGFQSFAGTYFRVGPISDSEPEDW